MSRSKARPRRQLLDSVELPAKKLPQGQHNDMNIREQSSTPSSVISLGDTDVAEDRPASTQSLRTKPNTFIAAGDRQHGEDPPLPVCVLKHRF